MHIIYYINRSIATKVDSTHVGLLNNSTQRICLVARGGLELVTFRSQSPTLSLYNMGGGTLLDLMNILIGKYYLLYCNSSQCFDIVSSTCKYDI